MANTKTKTLQTRLQLKYDTYANWTNENLGAGKGADLVLLEGEITCPNCGELLEFDFSGLCDDDCDCGCDIFTAV